jgi:predicted Zn-dependent protease
MTRDGTFAIEGGRVGRPVKNLRFTESILEALGRVGGVGRDLEAVPTHWTPLGAYLAPALCLRAFRFTGRSR